MGMLITFICMAVGGGFFLIFSAAMGGDHDVHVDHDVDGADHEGDHGSGSVHHWLSLKVIAGFCTLFGAMGCIAKAFELGNLPSLGVATLSGIAGAFLIDALLVFLYKQQSNSAFSVSSLVGQTGTVMMAIQPGQFGEVSVTFHGNTSTNRAKCVDTEMTIAQGAQVKVVFADSMGFVVETA